MSRKTLEAAKNWFETIRTQAEQIPANHPYRQCDETLAECYDWFMRHAGCLGRAEIVKFAQKRYAETL